MDSFFFSIATNVKALAGAVLVVDTDYLEIACRHFYVGATGMAFRHGVAGGDVEGDWDVGTFDASVFAGVEEGVLIRSVDDVIVFLFLIGIHTNTSFLMCTSHTYI